MRYILVIDQGTTSSRASLYNEKAQVVAYHQEEFRQIYPQNGYVEHNPLDILNSVKNVIEKALQKANIAKSAIVGVGITNQRETVVMWDKETGKPIYNALVWQCRRTIERCEELKEAGYEEVIRSKTGLTIDPYFSATKIEWLLNNIVEARVLLEKGSLLVGTIDTYLMWAL